MTLYCIYDGKVAYPAQREHALAYQEFDKNNPDVGPKDLFDKWKEVAAERGWDPGVAGKPVTPYGEPKTEYDVNGQFIMAGFIGLFGLIFVSKFFLNRGRWIKSDEHGLSSSEKREVKFEQITALNKKKWQNKGIAKVIYEVEGRKNKIVLDDCNYDRDTTQAILRHVEAKIGLDKIIHGKPEPPPKPAGDAASAVG
jgi:hypothetical protein